MEENLEPLYQQEERAYTNCDYERARKIRYEINKRTKRNELEW